MRTGGMYHLNADILALEMSESESSLITLPSGSVVTLAVTEPEASGLIVVSFGGRKVKLFLVDLEARGERIEQLSA